MSVAIRRNEYRGGAGGRNQKALARLHSGGSLNRSHAFAAEGGGSSAAPTGHASFAAERNTARLRVWWEAAKRKKARETN